MKRKALMARLDLADKISEIALRKGTLYDYVNDVLQQAVRAEDLGLSLRNVLDDLWLIKTARDSGFTVIPEKIIYSLAEQISGKKAEKRLKNLWYETGQWYGKYYETIDQMERSIRKCFWDIAEFSIKKENGLLTVTCLSSKFSSSYTELFGKFLEGIFNSLGYELKKGEVSKGIILLVFISSKGM